MTTRRKVGFSLVVLAVALFFVIGFLPSRWLDYPAVSMLTVPVLVTGLWLTLTGQRATANT